MRVVTQGTLTFQDSQRLRFQVGPCIADVWTEYDGIRESSGVDYLAFLTTSPERFRGKGWGSRMMKDLCAWADERRRPLTLIAVADGVNQDRLVAFYKRFGFKEYSESRMIRYPIDTAIAPDNVTQVSAV